MQGHYAVHDCIRKHMDLQSPQILKPGSTTSCREEGGSRGGGEVRGSCVGLQRLLIYDIGLLTLQRRWKNILFLVLLKSLTTSILMKGDCIKQFDCTFVLSLHVFTKVNLIPRTHQVDVFGIRKRDYKYLSSFQSNPQTSILFICISLKVANMTLFVYVVTVLKQCILNECLNKLKNEFCHKVT